MKSSLCDFGDAYILVSGTITTDGARADDAAKIADKRDKEVTFTNCAPFTDCISEIDNTQIDNAKDLDVVMLIHHLIECSDNCSKYLEVYCNVIDINQMLL